MRRNSRSVFPKLKDSEERVCENEDDLANQDGKFPNLINSENKALKGGAETSLTYDEYLKVGGIHEEAEKEYILKSMSMEEID